MKEWLLCALCYCYAASRGRAVTPTLPPKRVVVVQMAKLGDMVCTTPVFHAIKQKYPEASLSVVGNRINGELLVGNPDIDTYLEFSGIFPMIRTLRAGHYDFGCITAPSAPLLAVLFLAGVRAIVVPTIENGTSPNDTPAYRFLTRLCLTRPHVMSSYAPRQYLHLLEPLEIHTEDTAKHLAVSATATKRIEKFFMEQGVGNDGKILLGVAPSAGHKTKEWFPERFAAVVAELVRHHALTTVLIGAVGDRGAAEAVKAHLPEGISVVDTCGLFSIEEAKALISKLDLLLAVDTMSIYIAEAFSIPTVDITGPIDEHEQPPIGPLHLVVTPSAPRTPQLFVMNARSYDAQEVVRQLDSITVPMVVETVETLLGRI